jgi:ABC-type polysaccharide/polyol phosphate transport system ATPase subunit
MSNPVIRVAGIGKKYLIGHRHDRGESYVALRDVLARGARNAARSLGDLIRGRPNVAGDEVEEFWALRDVSFDVGAGDVVGIIGSNGAGKSTLLKVLSRITEPSAGRAEIRGRIATLLEVGTGFHPELTGRENIMLNGAILGMSRAEVRAKFDEIVDFAGVERFLDTPVKRYSSGMYVRLAFSVAAHLEPEILVVDEVLAVGDADFQKKCLGKMQSVTRSGRTVLFVSHNTAALASICNRGIVLASGQVVFDGGIEAALARYRDARDRGERVVDVSSNLKLSMRVADHRSNSPDRVPLCLSLEVGEPEQMSELCLLVYSEAGARVGVLDLREALGLPLALPSGRSEVDIDLDVGALVEQDYSLGVYLCSGKVRGNFENLTTLSVAPRVRPGPRYATEHLGFVDFTASPVRWQEGLR